MAEGHGWGGTSRARSNHPALACASAAPPYPRRGAVSRTYVTMYSRRSLSQPRSQPNPTPVGQRVGVYSLVAQFIRYHDAGRYDLLRLGLYGCFLVYGATLVVGGPLARLLTVLEVA